MAAEKTAQVMIRLTPELLAEIKQIALEEERTVAQTVRLAIRSYLDRHNGDGGRRDGEQE